MIQRRITNHKKNNLHVVGCTRVFPVIILKLMHVKYRSKNKDTPKNNIS